MVVFEVPTGLKFERDLVVSKNDDGYWIAPSNLKKGHVVLQGQKKAEPAAKAAKAEKPAAKKPGKAKAKKEKEAATA